MISVCRRPSVGSKLCAKRSVKSVGSVREKIPSVLLVCHLIEWVRSFSHRRTQKNRTHKGAQRHQVNRYHRTLQPPLAITFCEFCMPKAFCGLELCAKMLSELCVLCERKNSPASLKNVLFLTDNTEEQNTQHSTETLSQPISQNLTATEASPPRGCVKMQINNLTTFNL